MRPLPKFLRKPRLPKEPLALLRRAVRLHGHPGPFLALGVRLGLKARERLEEKGYFGIKVEVGCKLKTPFSCIIDGVIASTGCTPGKRNLLLKQANFPYLKAKSEGGKEVTVKPKKSLWERLCSGFPYEEMASLSQEVALAPEEEVLEVVKGGEM